MLKGLFTKPKLIKEPKDDNKTQDNAPEEPNVDNTVSTGDRTANLTKLVRLILVL